MANLYNEELERAVIGSVLMKGCVSPTERNVSTLDFFYAPHILLWSKILEIDEDGEQVEPFELHRRCVETNQTFALRISEITNFTNGVPPSTLTREITRLRDLANSRRLRGLLTGLADSLGEGTGFCDVIAEAEDALTTLKKSADISERTARQLYEVMETEVFPRLDKFVSGEVVKLPFGFPALDEITNGGVSLGELVVLGSKPKTGKSALILQIAGYHGQLGVPSLVVSREMLNFENGFRFLAQNSQYTNNIFRPHLHPAVADRLKDIGRKHKDLPMFLDDRSKKVSEIRRQAKTFKDLAGLRSVFVDYAQLIRPDARKQHRADELEAVYYELKELAQDLELAVYVNAQFNRVGIKSDRPTMADFDGSSAAEKAGNLILLWQLEKDYDEIYKGKKGTLWIEAGRNVGNGEFKIIFHGPHSRFSFLEK